MNSENSVDIQALNTLGLPCTVDRLLTVSSEHDLISAIKQFNIAPGNYFILGGGSNLILPEKLALTAIKLNMSQIQFRQVDSHEMDSHEWQVEVEAGYCWDELVKECVARGLRGIENLSLIPGEVGAAPIQNIGAYGVELADVLLSVDAYDFEQGCVVRLQNSDCGFAYRESVFKRDSGRYIILRVTLRLSEIKDFNLAYGPLRDLEARGELSVSDVRECVIEIRQSKIPDPSTSPNAGSFFKNPIVSLKQYHSILDDYPEVVSYPVDDNYVKLAAAWLIDRAGWKGVKKGPVGVHDQQALVIVNYQSAKQEDVLTLAREITNSIAERYGVALEIEPRVMS